MDLAKHIWDVHPGAHDARAMQEAFPRTMAEKSAQTIQTRLTDEFGAATTLSWTLQAQLDEFGGIHHDLLRQRHRRGRPRGRVTFSIGADGGVVR